MSRILGIIEVPDHNAGPNSSHHKLSPASRRFGDNSLLEWVVRRVTDSMLLDQVLVVVDAAQSDQVLHLVPPNIPVHVGHQHDSLSRIAAAARRYEANAIVRVPLISPFVDPQLIDRLICTANAHPSAEYIGYVSSQGGPAVLSQLGVFAEWCCTAAIYQADREAVHTSERGDATRYIYGHPELFKLRLIPIPAKLDRPDLRLKVNFEEDWDHAQTIFEALGPEALDWQRIAELLDQHPALRKRMADLNRSEQGSPTA
jgi:spore coat polysaccharide biosynthesis protein SpsF